MVLNAEIIFCVGRANARYICRMDEQRMLEQNCGTGKADVKAHASQPAWFALFFHLLTLCFLLGQVA